MQSDRRIRCKFKGCVTKSLLCVRSKCKGASRAARAQCAYPVLSAKRRHQLHHVGHRVGSAEHLRQHRQSARGQHEGSAAVGPLRLVRAARQDALAHGTCGMRIPWLASMVQGPDGPREMRGDSGPHASGRSCASLLFSSHQGDETSHNTIPTTNCCCCFCTTTQPACKSHALSSHP